MAENVEWMRAEAARRRLASLTADAQHVDGIARLARAGLHPVKMDSLADVFAEIAPPCL